MSKADELRRSMGGAMAETVMHRPPPAAMPPMGGQGMQLPPRIDGVARSRVAFDIDLDRITPDPDQPRVEFEPDALIRLAESIRKKGLLQPISVRRVGTGDRFMIVAGERRWRAARHAGLPTIACVVFEREVPPGELLAIQCIENLLREDLSKTDQARAFRTLLTVNHWTQAELAKELGISQPTVSQSLELLELPEEVRDQVDRGRLASSVAATIAAEIDDPIEQRALADRFVREGTTREEAKAAVRKAAGRRPAPKAAGKGGGASAGPVRVRERTIRAGDLKIVATGSKGRAFDLTTLLASLESAADQVRAEIGTGQGGDPAP